MALFQKSVLNKYLKGLDQSVVDAAYKKFSAHFHNPAIQLNIRKSKEEQYQGEFLIDLFVKVLGYTKSPEPNFNLTTEFKNIKNAKKADGAILVKGKAIAVIELKGMDTPNLDKVEGQAFGYKSNQPDAIYVITSNFEKLRFYIDNAVDYIEWNLFNLTKEQFNEVWLCLAKESVLSGLPKQIKEDSIIEEKTITERLYKDYSTFRSELYNSITKKNPDIDPLLLFKKTQKLLDRFLFIFFAEDRLLVPPNSIARIIDHWKKLEELDNYKPLYAIFQQYFGYFNNGRKGKKSVDDIFAYNGGLFKRDAILDKIKIDDYVLFKHTQKLTKYDFVSEVDVNILGHIFEHSLNDIEEIAAQLEGEALDKSKTKRKKDGVFYTPKYITKYIVENTVGKLCEEKKTGLGINDIDFSKTYLTKNKRTTKDGKKTFLSAEGEKILNGLTEYREYLLGLTICDPACGSGAFLNQAFNYLIDEHENIDQYNASLRGDMLTLTDVSKDILENNLFGVDINNEAVEIAKLSLWLRTAQKGRKLNNLNENIKCGNSLIDDSEVAGEKAFNWEKEFSAVFKNGGFDVVIGNPPYLRVQGLKTHFEDESKFYEKIYKCATRRYDIYSLFMEKSISLINQKGRVTYILPHKFLVVDAGLGIRKFLSEKKAVESLIHFREEMVFKDASAYTCIITLTNNNESLSFKHISPSNLFSNEVYNEIDYSKLNENNWNLTSNKITNLIEKLSIGNPSVKEIFSSVGAGVDAGADDIFMMEGKVENDLFIGFSTRLGKEIELEKDIVKPLLKGEDVKRYNEFLPEKFILYPHYSDGKKTKPISAENFKIKYPLAFTYISQFKEEMIARKIRKKTNPEYWYSLHRSRNILNFEGEKIITPEISLGTNMTLDTNGYFHNTKVYYIIKKEDVKEQYKYLLGILNSSIMWFYLKSIGYVLRGGYFTFKTKFLEPFPIVMPKNLIQENQVVEKVEIIISKTKDFNTKTKQFQRILGRRLAINNFTKNIQNWHTLTFAEFIKELKKKKIKLGLAEETEWEEYFETEKAKVV